MNTASKLNLFQFSSLPIRTFWITSIAFFICFFAWFGIIPFMPDVVKSLALTPTQKWNSVVLAVAGTVFARLIIGRLCDIYGPRICYTFLLALGSIPVFLIGLSESATEFLIYRFFIGFIGASFVITQFHTSLMFAPNVVGTANATSAGWGNLGGGANRLIMPALAALFVGFGIAKEEAWRWAMEAAGVICLIMAFVYYRYTQDTPDGNFSELKATGRMPKLAKDQVGFLEAAKDYRVWILFAVYAACFGIELTVYGTMDDYLQNSFSLSRIAAGNIVLSFALMNIFARTLGGYFGDLFGNKYGLRGRVLVLSFILVIEGLVLSMFATIDGFALAIFTLIVFSLTVQMAEGATFSVVPFINKKAIGSISGIVGAGGNVGAFLAALFLKSKSAAGEQIALIESVNLSPEAATALQASAAAQAVSSGYFYIGIAVLICGLLALGIRFSLKVEKVPVGEAVENAEMVAL